MAGNDGAAPSPFDSKSNALLLCKFPSFLSIIEPFRKRFSDFVTFGADHRIRTCVGRMSAAYKTAPFNHSGKSAILSLDWRKERDSNSHTLSGQLFSRQRSLGQLDLSFLNSPGFLPACYFSYFFFNRSYCSLSSFSRFSRCFLAFSFLTRLASAFLARTSSSVSVLHD